MRASDGTIDVLGLDWAVGLLLGIGAVISLYLMAGAPCWEFGFH